MVKHRSPDDADLHWPVARSELDDLPTLELGPDQAGRLAWQNMTPPGPDTYRTWLPRREQVSSSREAAEGFDDDPFMSLFASEAAPAIKEATAEPVEPPMPTPLEGWEPVTVRLPPGLTGPRAELPLRTEDLSTDLTAATSTPPPSPSTEPTAPLRLSLAPMNTRGRAALTALADVVPVRSRLEQAALFGTGAVFGAIAALAVVTWRPADRPASSAARSPAGNVAAPVASALLHNHPIPVGVVRLARPVVPRARLTLAGTPTLRGAAPDTADERRAPAPEHAGARQAAPRTGVPAPAQGRTSPVQLIASAASLQPPPASPAPPAARRSAAKAAATPPPPPPRPVAAPPEALAAINRFAAAYNRMDARATQATWPSADRQALVTTFTALREQHLTLSGCRGTMQTGDTASVMCRGTLRYRPRVGNHDTRTVEGTWRFTMLQRADDWVVDGLESP